MSCSNCGYSCCQEGSTWGSRLGKQTLQQLEVQQLNSWRRNASRKPPPFLPSPRQEGNPGQQCSITDCSARHTCKGRHDKLIGKYTCRKTTRYSRLLFFSCSIQFQPCISWSHITKEYKPSQVQSESHCSHLPPTFPELEQLEGWQPLNHTELTLTISILCIF